MNTSSIGQSGLNGIRDALTRADDAAARIARGNIAAEPADQLTALVELDAARQQAAVAARVVEAGDRMLGTLLDLHV